MSPATPLALDLDPYERLGPFRFGWTPRLVEMHVDGGRWHPPPGSGDARHEWPGVVVRYRNSRQVREIHVSSPCVVLHGGMAIPAAAAGVADVEPLDSEAYEVFGLLVLPRLGVVVPQRADSAGAGPVMVFAARTLLPPPS